MSCCHWLPMLRPTDLLLLLTAAPLPLGPPLPLGAGPLDLLLLRAPACCGPLLLLLALAPWVWFSWLLPLEADLPLTCPWWSSCSP